jgi:hypothetical protein
VKSHVILWTIPELYHRDYIKIIEEASMSLENSSIEEINAELERRKIAGQAEI